MAKVVSLALAAIFAVVPMKLAAKNVTSSDSSNNAKAVAGVAGPASAANSSHSKKSAKRSKKMSQKALVTPPPPMHDPN